MDSTPYEDDRADAVRHAQTLQDETLQIRVELWKRLKAFRSYIEEAQEHLLICKGELEEFKRRWPEP